MIEAMAGLATEETQISSSCIVVIDREYEAQRVRIGVIVGDIDEVMQLAAGTATASAETGISANMDLVVKMFDTPNPQEWLAERHGEPRLLHATPNRTLAVAVQTRHAAPSDFVAKHVIRSSWAAKESGRDIKRYRRPSSVG
ncbi:MAG: hypothetical protein JSW27_18485 [Phycisphaerales bacterium]|nr:MAG: hypothetical protein JSW27_18485 [Phycisphaerales bacterium]